MVDSSKFAGFLDKADARLRQIEQSLGRHEKNPKDREFLNDVQRAVHAIKNAALPVGLGRISELCFHLENFLQRIRQERIDISQEKNKILIACTSRLGKLVDNIRTDGKERAAVKDLLKQIQQELENTPAPAAEEPESQELFPDTEPRTPGGETLTPALEDLSPEPAASEQEGADDLLPEEIRNQEYDRELFQIFLEQMQEKLSLLRALTNDYETSAHKAKTIALCSDLVGKLQTSANYMGYERLADYYIQWVAELEMAGVELSMGTPVALDFMEQRIRTIVGLFPQVKDTPASPAAVRGAEKEMAPSQPVVRDRPAPAAELNETVTFKDLFSDIGEAEPLAFDETAPIAALSGFAPQEREKPAATPSKGVEAAAGRKRMRAAPVEIDASFLEEERQSPEFDEELFQIFVQQLQENLSQLRALVNAYPNAAGKGALITQCSTLVGKLQSSANYMGYERLAEYYLQWIAELEMAGVDLSLGTPVSFSFMEDKIAKILEIFPQVRDVAAPPEAMAEPELPAQPAPPRKPAARVPEESESFQDLFRGMDAEEESIFAADTAPVAALSDTGEDSAWEGPPPGATANLAEVDSFFGEPGEEEPAPAPPRPFDVEALFGEAAAPLAPEPVAALSQTEEGPSPLGEGPSEEAVVPEIDSFFGAFAEGGEESFDIGAEPIAALSGEEIVPAPLETEPAKPAGSRAGEDIEALFLEEGEEPAAAPAGPEREGIGELSAVAGGDDLDFELEDESVAALADTVASEMSAPAVEPLSPGRGAMGPGEDLAALFGEEEELTVPEPAVPPAPPERRELFRKLSDALKEMEEEVPTLEAAMDKSRARAAAPAEPSTAAGADQQLFARLFGALEATAEDDDRSAAKPIDQVLEEILAPAEIQPVPAQPAPAPAQPAPAELPGQITAPDIGPAYGLDPASMDSLMEHVGELAASRSSLSRLHQEMSGLHHRLQEKSALAPNELTPLQDLLLRLEDTASTLGRVSSGISEEILKVRLIPAGQLFGIYREIVGEMARKDGKEVELAIRGEDAEIDQFTVADINDCLLHLISNGITHGLEPPEERRRLGKKPAGALTLAAFHAQNCVVIEVADDGRGLDPKRIKATALAREMRTGDELYRMSDQDLTRLIMTPGFSTSAGVTPDAKGAGLDRVSRSIEKLGGRIQIQSEVGRGTSIRLFIPLRLPTVQTLKVKAGEEIFALPLACVEEIVRVTPENLIRTGEAELITFRHDHIRLHPLAEIAGLPSSPRGTRFPVVVVNTEAGAVGLIVDETVGLDEMPVKPLAEYLREHRDFAGAAIKGEDDTSFIPDISGLMKTAHEAARI